MARVPLDIDAHGGLGRLAAWYSRRRFGVVAEPVAAIVHNRAVAVSYAAFETLVDRTWKRLDPGVAMLALLRTASAIGCSWCQDFGYWEAQARGVDPRKVHDVVHWRDSDAYTDLERAVLEYAEAMTATPPEVSDELVAGLRAQLGDAGLVELTALIALENFRSRCNSALGLQSQGFKDRCDMPAVTS